VKFWLHENGGGEKKCLKLSSVQNRFRFVKSEGELNKWKKEFHEERNMHQNETLKSLKERLFERFRTARESGPLLMEIYETGIFESRMRRA
jgi:hypothetical protein